MGKKAWLTVIVLSVLVILLVAGYATRGVAAEEPSAEYCPPGMDQVTEWSEGICGDEDFIEMSLCQPPGEIWNPGPDSRQAAIKILSVYGRYHCLQNPALWPITPEVTGTFPITMDEIVIVDIPSESRWGLGGDDEYCHAPHEQFLPLVLKRF